MRMNPWSEGKADQLPGSQAAATARIVMVVALCSFQYWLLTATMEAYHAGNTKILAASLAASLLCFFLAVGLLLAGEVSAKMMNEEMEKAEPPKFEV